MPLAGHKYIPVDGMPHCLACWKMQHGKVCSACRGLIDPQGQRVSLGEHHWHANAECFKCGVCQTSLMGGKMSMRQGTLLCSSQCGQVLALQGDRDTNMGHSIIGKLLRDTYEQGQSSQYGQDIQLPNSQPNPNFLNKQLHAPDLSPNRRHASHARQKSQDIHTSKPLEIGKHERSASYGTIV